MATASVIAVNTTITGMISSPNDIDYYKISNTSTETNIKVVLSNLPADYDLNLYNVSGSLVATSQNAGNTNETITYNNAPVGSYYILVLAHKKAKSSNCYTLNTAISSTAYAKTGSFTTIEETKTESTLFPNPASSEVHVSITASRAANINIQLIDQLGRVIKVTDYNAIQGQNELVIETGKIPSGIYFVRIQNGETMEIKKLLVNNN